MLSGMQVINNQLFIVKEWHFYSALLRKANDMVEATVAKGTCIL